MVGVYLQENMVVWIKFTIHFFVRSSFATLCLMEKKNSNLHLMVVYVIENSKIFKRYLMSFLCNTTWLGKSVFFWFSLNFWACMKFFQVFIISQYIVAFGYRFYEKRLSKSFKKCWKCLQIKIFRTNDITRLWDVVCELGRNLLHEK